MPYLLRTAPRRQTGPLTPIARGLEQPKSSNDARLTVANRSPPTCSQSGYRQGRSFFRRLIYLASTVNRLNSFVRLNTDIIWWKTFTHKWNGTSCSTATAAAPLHIQTLPVYGAVQLSQAQSGSNCNDQHPIFLLQNYTFQPQKMITIVILQQWYVAGLVNTFHTDNTAV